jgi:tetratricopeptide (TPR) repeat protein
LLELGRSYDPLQGPAPQDVPVLERAAAAAPDSLAAWCELELAYRMPGYEAKHDQVLQKCLEWCDRRLAEKRGDGRALKHKARLLQGAEDWAGSEQLLRTVVDDTPEDQETCFFLAHALNRQERHEEAGPLYDRVCTLDSRTVWAYMARRQLATHLAFRKGEAGRAVALMEEVWALTRRLNEADNLIYFHSASGQLREALAVYKEVEECQHHPRVWVTVGLGYRESGDLQAAERAYQAAIAATTDPGLRAEAQLHRAAVLFSLEKAEEARQALSEGLALDLEARGGLASDRVSAFWRPWTERLAETLGSLVPNDRRAEQLLQAVQRELGQGST